MKIESEARDYSRHPLYLTMHRFWHPVAYSSEVADKPMQVTLLDQHIVLARIEGRVVALADRCAHRGAALSVGMIVDGQFECPYHGWRYDAAGHCTRIPARNEMVAVMKPRIPAFHVCESAGIVWVCLDPEPKFPVPDFPEFDDPAYRLQQGPAYDWETSAPRRLENFVDFSHFAFVHDGSIGSRSRPEVDTVEPWREGHVLRFERPPIKEPSVGQKRKMLGIEGDDWIAVANSYRVTMPHTVHLRRSFENGKHYVLMMAASPISAVKTRSFWWIARDFATEPENDDFLLDFERVVLEQDKPVIESQQPKLAPMVGEEVRLELPVGGADAVTLAYRRWYMELIKETQSGAVAATVA
ncbi:aromatic ring-hydroxylating oxygenase subunit alpha [Pusillimonas caeni]|uniref:aromatic ring-hydroxylating dioxygenase subunit alpha n=1 Tax=Pusillimonas caeni TaxID=1348472 RepID=UPI001FD7EC06|nr:aromatic ring-hydroxylating dioxygenase subunit alpha [Pusillimonas caeni]